MTVTESSKDFYFVPNNSNLESALDGHMKVLPQ